MEIEFARDSFEDLIYLWKTILLGGINDYKIKLKAERAEIEEELPAWDNYHKNNWEGEEPKTKILNKERYLKSYLIVDDLKYSKTSFDGVLDFKDDEYTNLQHESEKCEAEIQKLMILLWKKKVFREEFKPTVERLVNTVKSVCEIFSIDNLELTFDVKSFDESKFDQEEFVANLVTYNQIIEEITKLFNQEKDQTYFAELYSMGGLSNLLDFYNWLHDVTIKLAEISEKRIFLSKHLQMLWSNLGDFYLTILEKNHIDSNFNSFNKTHDSAEHFYYSLYNHVFDNLLNHGNLFQFCNDHS